MYTTISFSINLPQPHQPTTHCYWVCCVVQWSVKKKRRRLAIDKWSVWQRQVRCSSTWILSRQKIISRLVMSSIRVFSVHYICHLICHFDLYPLFYLCDALIIEIIKIIRLIIDLSIILMIVLITVLIILLMIVLICHQLVLSSTKVPFIRVAAADQGANSALIAIATIGGKYCVCQGLSNQINTIISDICSYWQDQGHLLSSTSWTTYCSNICPIWSSGCFDEVHFLFCRVSTTTRSALFCPKS